MMKPFKILRIEYFDDRFYKLYLPPYKELPKEINHLPTGLIKYEEENTILYITSVTTIIDEQFVRKGLQRARGTYGNFEMDKRMEAGATRGSSVHDLCYKRLQGTHIIYQNPKTGIPKTEDIDAYAQKNHAAIEVVHDQEYQLMLWRFGKLMNVLNPTILSIEEIVYNIEEMYAGTIDIVLSVKEGLYNFDKKPTKLKGGIYVCDIKTGAFFDKEAHFMQTSSYTHAHSLEKDIVGSLIFHLNADSRTGIVGCKVHVAERAEMKQYYHQFLNLKDLHYWRNKDISPIQLEIPVMLEPLKIKTEYIDVSKQLATGKKVRPVSKKPKAKKKVVKKRVKKTKPIRKGSKKRNKKEMTRNLFGGKK